MAFAEGTQIFTNKGFKNIEDIAGHDKVMVRNFIGDAEFIQPFALKKRKYEGEIVQVGGGNWNVIVTPEHKIMYNLNEYGDIAKYRYVPAGEMTISREFKLHRKFRYMLMDEPAKEIIKIRDDLGERRATISNEDWYVLMAYVLTRGYIRREGNKYTLLFYIKKGNVEKDTKIVGGILDQYGIPWSLSKSAQDVIVVSSRNTIAARMITRLGSVKRKDMYLPAKVVYNSPRALIRLLVETIISNSMNPGSKRGFVYQLSTTNTKLIDTLLIMGTIGGYSMTKYLKEKAGTPSKFGVSKRDSYSLKISTGHDTYAPKYIKKSDYLGYVYEIDLFDGQVYARGGSMPVWIDPK